jgi:hypothetical protein
MVLARFKARALSEKQGERSERKTNNPKGSIPMFHQSIANKKTSKPELSRAMREVFIINLCYCKRLGKNYRMKKTRTA